MHQRKQNHQQGSTITDKTQPGTYTCIHCSNKKKAHIFESSLVYEHSLVFGVQAAAHTKHNHAYQVKFYGRAVTAQTTKVYGLRFDHERLHSSSCLLTQARRHTSRTVTALCFNWLDKQHLELVLYP